MKKIFICGINQESNSFNNKLATRDFFVVKSGKDLAESNVTRLKGVLKGMEEENMSPIFGSYFWSSPGSPVADEVIKEFIETIEKELRSAGKIDGVAIMFHGATVSASCDDVCGYVSEFIRNIVGNGVPITASFDLHANITEKIARNIDLICSFQKYPHLDVFETGYRSIKMLGEYFKDNSVKTYRVTIPMIASASGYTTDTKELKALMDKGRALVDSGDILDFSILQVQPWLDVPEMASTVIVIGKNEQTAKKIAGELALGEFSLREKLQGENLLSVEEIIEKARENNSDKPVIICDSADSPNAGAAGDSAFVLGKLLAVKNDFDIAVAVNDIPAVDKAFTLGVGGVGDFTLGATVCPELSKPITVKNATVKCLSDGEFTMCGPQERGEKRNIGKCAVIKTGRMNILIAYDGKREGDRGFYRFVGIDPELMDIVSVKACTSFRAGYESVSAAIYNAETTGAATPVLKSLPYKKRPTLYPFESITAESISEPKRYR